LPRSILIDAGNYPTIIEAYRALIVELAQGLGSTETIGNLQAAASAVIELETKIANISGYNENPYNTSAIFHPFKLNEFQAVMDSIDSTFSVI